MSVTISGTYGLQNMPSTAAPAFSAYLSANQGVSSGTTTKVAFNVKEFDTASCYDNTTNYRFTPNVAGHYLVNIVVRLNPNNVQAYALVYKNGTAVKQGIMASGFYQFGASLTALVYCNGTSDYLEGYVFNNGSVNNFVGASTDTFFQAFLARAA